MSRHGPKENNPTDIPGLHNKQREKACGRPISDHSIASNVHNGSMNSWRFARLTVCGKSSGLGKKETKEHPL